MINLQMVLTKEEISHLMFHSTFRANLHSIKALGLGAKQPKNWSFSNTGDICFSSDPDVAYSFCESADAVSDTKYNSGIVVLAVPYWEGCLTLEDANCNGVRNCFCVKGMIIPRERIFVVVRKGNDLYLAGRLVNLRRVPSYEQ